MCIYFVCMYPSHGGRFITAASDGDLDAVKAYLKDGLDVNSQDWDKLTALVAAASQGHLKVVKLLLDKVRSSSVPFASVRFR